MARVPLVLLLLAACGGPQIPAHNGYKSEKAKPWKKAKTLKFDDKGEAKVEGDLSYPDMRRAAWYLADLTTHGRLELRLEITPPGDATNDDFDLALEILDPGNRVVAKSDLEEADSHELTKTKSLVDLAPGKYLIHLYLQGRLDTADYVLHAAFKQTASSEARTDFPAQVAFLPALAMVPLDDDTPKTYHPPAVATVHTRTKPKDPPKDAPPPPAAMTARIIGLTVVAGGMQITIGRGTGSGASAGMQGKIANVPSGSFTLTACSERTCTATVTGVTADQLKGAGSVTLTP